MKIRTVTFQRNAFWLFLLYSPETVAHIYSNSKSFPIRTMNINMRFYISIIVTTLAKAYSDEREREVQIKEGKKKLKWMRNEKKKKKKKKKKEETTWDKNLSSW